MGMPKKGCDIHGVLVVDKPGGLTSSGVVRRLKGWSKAKKVGHTGALDPMATGVLPIVFGEAAKYSQYCLDSNKGYLARIQLGTATDTLDSDGVVVAKKAIPIIDEFVLLPVLNALTGLLMQVPPMVSALKHKGQPLYKLARQGLEIERAPREIEIFSNELIGFEAGKGWLDIRIRCSKGTYIRSIAESIGKSLGTVAHLSRLRRDFAGGYSIDQAKSWETVESLKNKDVTALAKLLHSTDTLLGHLPRINLSEHECMMLIQGQKVSGKGIGVCDTMRAYFEEASFIGLVVVDSDGDIFSKRMLSPAAAGMRGSSGVGRWGRACRIGEKNGFIS